MEGWLMAGLAPNFDFLMSSINENPVNAFPRQLGAGQPFLFIFLFVLDEAIPMGDL